MYSRNTNERDYGDSRIRVPGNYRGNAFNSSDSYRRYQAAPVPAPGEIRAQDRTPSRAVHLSDPSVRRGTAVYEAIPNSAADAGTGGADVMRDDIPAAEDRGIADGGVFETGGEIKNRGTGGAEDVSAGEAKETALHNKDAHSGGKKPREDNPSFLSSLFGRDGKSMINFDEIIMIGILLFIMQSDKDEDAVILLALLLLCN